MSPKGSLAVQPGAECGEFVVKQRVLVPVQLISRERNRGIGQGGMLPSRPRTLCDQLHELRKDRAAHVVRHPPLHART